LRFARIASKTLLELDDSLLELDDSRFETLDDHDRGLPLNESGLLRDDGVFSDRSLHLERADAKSTFQAANS
jgi:hypothetical protein